MPKNPIPSAISLFMHASLAAVACSARAQTTGTEGSPVATIDSTDYQVIRIAALQGSTSPDASKATPQWLGMYNLFGTWPGRTMQWYFNPANIPTNLNADQVVAILQKATAKWEGMCNFRFQYMGTTSQGIDIRPTPVSNDGMNVWGFDTFDSSMSKFAGYAPTQVISYFDGRPATITQGDIKFNKNEYWTAEIFEGMATARKRTCDWH